MIMGIMKAFRLPLLASLMALILLAIPAPSQAQIAVGISVHVGPPALPVYAQPICPGPGYIWTPGYWGYGDEGYYWVPGTWVVAPAVGLLWTPGYWGWGGGVYVWHGGYWGPHVGFYGGINYGFGYGGVGFVGGEWRGGVFNYNRSVTNVNVTVVHNTYNTTVVNNNTTVNRTSFNGGEGGVTAKPTAAEEAAAKENHVQPTSAQIQHEHSASTNRAQLASVNHGQPTVAASAKPGQFSGKGVVAAKPASSTHTASTKGTNPNKPPTASSVSTKGTNSNNKPGTANASNLKTDRPPSAQTKTAATAKTNTSSGANNTKGTTNTASNAHTANPAHASQSASHSSNRPANSQPKSQPHPSNSKPAGHNKPAR
jgi:hypothetical protein